MMYHHFFVFLTSTTSFLYILKKSAQTFPPPAAAPKEKNKSHSPSQTHNSLSLKHMINTQKLRGKYLGEKWETFRHR